MQRRSFLARLGALVAGAVGAKHVAAQEVVLTQNGLDVVASGDLDYAARVVELPFTITTTNTTNTVWVQWNDAGEYQGLDGR
jgi:hypothetical protein